MHGDAIAYDCYRLIVGEQQASVRCQMLMDGRDPDVQIPTKLKCPVIPALADRIEAKCSDRQVQSSAPELIRSECLSVPSSR